jgi:hypothetical protein
LVLVAGGDHRVVMPASGIVPDRELWCSKLSKVQNFFKNHDFSIYETLLLEIFENTKQLK